MVPRRTTQDPFTFASEARSKRAYSPSGHSFASDSDDDDKDLTPRAKEWRDLYSDRELHHRSRDFSLQHLVDEDGADLYKTTREQIFKLLAQFAPEAPPQPFIAVSDNLCLMTTTHAETIRSLDNSVKVLKRQNTYGTEEFIDMKAEVKHIRNRNLQHQADRKAAEREHEDAILKLQTAMEAKALLHREEIKNLKAKHEEYRDTVLAACNRKDEMINTFRTEMIRIADAANAGDPNATTSRILDHERKVQATPRAMNINRLLCLSRK
ncbi:hypothetical protein CF319_g6284 [Tilletia indica]|uniref:Uncharacterized protein n=1 Tax=Tilletia indica TaxID=43049 RepID=A0A177T448_9BASI|nr:hypothetical protein CF319_g6284 [Tilletia indica]KAE8237092.1 hypothetical protein A4X13_0g8912 [Tilletia indica]